MHIIGGLADYTVLRCKTAILKIHLLDNCIEFKQKNKPAMGFFYVYCAPGSTN